MEIEYLQKMQQTPIIKNTQNKGVSETKIEQLEIKMGVKFPKAYKEFLFLGGVLDNMINNFQQTFEWLPSMQEDARESIREVGLSLRSFWCFAEYDSADSFLFFFLDEGDNPAVYSFMSIDFYEDEQGNTIHYKKFRNSFSEYIDKSIAAALK